MNKIYKVIWSKAKNCYVVVSELAKRNGKCKTSQTTLNRRKRLTDLLSINTPALTKAVAAMLLAGMIAVPNVAGAATITAKNSGTDINPASGTSVGMNNLAAGYNSQAKDNATAYGSNATATGKQSIAVGYYASTNEADQAIAIGSKVTTSGVDYAGAQASAAGAIAIGSARSKYSGAQATGTDAIALGTGSQATAQDATAVGRSSGALATKSLAVGATAKVDSAATGSVVVGYGARALTTNSLLLGYNAGYARPSPDYTAAGTASDGDGAIAIGYKAKIRLRQSAKQQAKTA